MWPHCHEQAMELLTHVEAAGAAKLTRTERLRWLAHGKQVLRRPGNRWVAALTTRAEGRAKSQRAAYEEATRAGVLTSSTQKRKHRGPAT